MLDAAPDGLVLVDADGAMLVVNRRMEVMFGYDRVQMLGQPVDTLLPETARGAHERHRQQYLAAPQSRPMGLGLGLVGRRKDGTEFPVEISLSPLPGTPERAVIAVVRDVSDHHAAATGQLAGRVADAELAIGQDLVDAVVRGLFGAGLHLQAALPRTDAGARDLVAEALDEIDHAIRAMRTMIFSLGDAIIRASDTIR